MRCKSLDHVLVWMNLDSSYACDGGNRPLKLSSNMKKKTGDTAGHQNW